MKNRIINHLYNDNDGNAYLIFVHTRIHHISFAISYKLSFKSRWKIIHYGDTNGLKQSVIVNFHYNYTDIVTLNTRESKIYFNQLLLSDHDKRNYYDSRSAKISLRNVTVFLRFYYNISLRKRVLSLLHFPTQL